LWPITLLPSDTDQDNAGKWLNFSSATTYGALAGLATAIPDSGGSATGG